MLCGDRSFTCPTWNLAEMLSKIANDNVRTAPARLPNIETIAELLEILNIYISDHINIRKYHKYKKYQMIEHYIFDI